MAGDNTKAVMRSATVSGQGQWSVVRGQCSVGEAAEFLFAVSQITGDPMINVMNAGIYT